MVRHKELTHMNNLRRRYTLILGKWIVGILSGIIGAGIGYVIFNL